MLQLQQQQCALSAPARTPATTASKSHLAVVATRRRLRSSSRSLHQPSLSSTPLRFTAARAEDGEGASAAPSPSSAEAPRDDDVS